MRQHQIVRANYLLTSSYRIWRTYILLHTCRALLVGDQRVSEAHCLRGGIENRVKELRARCLALSFLLEVDDPVLCLTIDHDSVNIFIRNILSFSPVTMKGYVKEN